MVPKGPQTPPPTTPPPGPPGPPDPLAPPPYASPQTAPPSFHHDIERDVLPAMRAQPDDIQRVEEIRVTLRFTGSNLVPIGVMGMVLFLGVKGFGVGMRVGG